MTILLDTLELPNLDWVDERYSPILQTKKRGLTGTHIINRSVRSLGRPVTLQGGANWGAITKAQLDALEAMANDPKDRNLTLRDGRVLVVQFDYPEPVSAFEWTGNEDTDQPNDDDLYIDVKIKLITTG